MSRSRPSPVTRACCCCCKHPSIHHQFQPTTHQSHPLKLRVLLNFFSFTLPFPSPFFPVNLHITQRPLGLFTHRLLSIPFTLDSLRLTLGSFFFFLLPLLLFVSYPPSPLDEVSLSPHTPLAGFHFSLSFPPSTIFLFFSYTPVSPPPIRVSALRTELLEASCDRVDST